MIKINLLTARKQSRSRSGATASAEVGGFGRNLAVLGILGVGVAVVAVWSLTLAAEQRALQRQNDEADRELKRLDAVRKKGDEYKAQKDLLARKIDLITDLKKQQEVPVHILDQVSKSLPDFLWLESMAANNSQISISGRATNYNAVSNFYSNLTQTGLFGDVALGRTFVVPEGVSFSLSCRFAPAAPAADEPSPKAKS